VETERAGEVNKAPPPSHPVSIELIASVAGAAASVAAVVGAAYSLGKKIALLEARLSQVENRVARLEGEVAALKSELASLEERLKGYVGERVGRLARAFAGYQEFMLEYLSLKGLLEEGEVRLAKGEARRLAELAANPFTKEEWERLKQLLDKEPEELTLEEAYELRDLARKAIEEYGDRYEAYALHVYASIAVGLAYRRLSGKREKAGQGGRAP